MQRSTLSSQGSDFHIQARAQVRAVTLRLSNINVKISVVEISQRLWVLIWLSESIATLAVPHAGDLR